MAISDTYISTLQASQALGVSISTVKRWVDEGRLPAHKTVGGHRKLLRADVLALARDADLPRSDLTELFPAIAANKKLAPQSLATSLLQSLISGQPSDVSGLIRRAYRSGMPVEVLADEVIAPVMRAIGHQWETARIDVWQEHRGTQMCLSALNELLPEIDQRAGRQRPLALGAGPAKDPYQLATLLAQLVLLDAGYSAVNLGPNTPFPNLLTAARQLKPRLIWLSVSHLENSDTFVRQYRDFYHELQRLGVAIAIGGQALTEPIRSQLPYTTYGDRLAQLAALARTLHPLPGLPRRGRPPREKERT